MPGFGFYSVHSPHTYRREIDDEFLRETGYELYALAELEFYIVGQLSEQPPLTSGQSSSALD